MFKILGIIGGVSFLLLTVVQLFTDLSKNGSSDHMELTLVEESWAALSSDNFHSSMRSLKSFFSSDEFRAFDTYILDTPVVVFSGVLSFVLLFFSLKSSFKKEY